MRTSVILERIMANPSVQVVRSDSLLDELADVLARPKITRRVSFNLETMLNIVRSKSVYVPVNESAFPPVCRDPKDDFVLALAAAAKATAIVSGDLDLLAMGEYGGCPIMTAAEFAAALEAEES